MTNFPQGFSGGLSLRGVPLLQTQPGNVFWLDNGVPSRLPNVSTSGNDGGHGTFQRPFASLAYALSQCQHNNGDIIMVKAGHQETIVGAGLTTLGVGANGTSIALNTAGVAIIGLGYGSMRPTFNFTTANTANIPVQSANMSIQNCLFTANFLAIASVFTAASCSTTASIAGNVLTVTAVGAGTLFQGMNLAATGVLPGTLVISQVSGTIGGIGTYLVNNSQTVASTTITGLTQDFNIENCEFKDTTSVLNFVSIMTGTTTANAIDGFRFANNRVSSLGTTAATTAIKALSATDRLQIKDNFGVSAILNDTAAILASGANNLTNLDFGRNVWTRPNTSSTGGSFVSSSSTACTGHCYDNYLYQLDNTAGIWIATGTGLSFSNNFSPITAAADKSGLINPAAV